MKFLPVIFMAVLAMGCSQQKSISKQQPKSVHRYSTVYQGNKILRYENVDQNQTEPFRPDINVPEVHTEVKVKRAKISSLNPNLNLNAGIHEQKTKRFQRKGQLKKLSNRTLKILKNSEEHESAIRLAWLGLFLIIAGLVLLSIGWAIAWGGSSDTEASILAVIGILAALTGLVFLIIGLIRGIKRNKSTRRNIEKGYDKPVKTGSFWSLMVFGLIVLTAGLLILFGGGIIAGLIVSGIGAITVFQLSFQLAKVNRHNRSLQND